MVEWLDARPIADSADGNLDQSLTYEIVDYRGI